MLDNDPELARIAVAVFVLIPALSLMAWGIVHGLMTWRSSRRGRWLRKRLGPYEPVYERLVAQGVIEPNFFWWLWKEIRRRPRG